MVCLGADTPGEHKCGTKWKLHCWGVSPFNLEEEPIQQFAGQVWGIGWVKKVRPIWPLWGEINCNLFHQLGVYQIAIAVSWGKLKLRIGIHEGNWNLDYWWGELKFELIMRDSKFELEWGIFNLNWSKNY